MRYLTYEEVKNLKIGETIIEDGEGRVSLLSYLTTTPEERIVCIFGKNHRQVTFMARQFSPDDVFNQREHPYIHFTMTEEHEHYGPRLRKA
jgi:hypothetical protein